MNDTLILIPARSGSTRIKDKNLKKIGEIPLIGHIITKALKSKCGRVVVSTDSEEIKNVAISFGAEVPFLRDAEYSTSYSSSLIVILHALKWFKENENWIPNYVMFTPGTSLFTSVSTLSENKAILINSDKSINSSITVCSTRTHPFSNVLIDHKTKRIEDHQIKIKEINNKNIVRSQDYPEVYEVCGCCTTTKSSYYIDLLNSVNWNILDVEEIRVADMDNCVASIVPQIQAIDINQKSDLDFARKMYEFLYPEKAMYKKRIKINSKIILRQLTIEDVADIMEYSKDKEFTKYLSFSSIPTEENTKNFINNINNDIKNNTRLYWGIEINNKIEGTIGFLNIDKENNEAELGFGISTKFWGKGIINQCMGFLLHMGFREFKYDSLLIKTNNNNTRTIEFSKKEGFIFDYQTDKYTCLVMSKEIFFRNFYL